MTTPYPIVSKYSYPELVATTFPSGGRVYETPRGHKVPSVTTILATLPKDGIIKWRNRIGDEEADRITDHACRVGTTMHDTLEGYVSNYLHGRPNTPPITDEDQLAYTMADNIKRYSLPDLDEIWGIEEALYCEDLYAGRTDLIGVYKGKSAVIDYKSSRCWKKPEWVESYKMQIAAYNLCHQSMFGEKMETGVIIIALRPDNPRFKRSLSIQRFILNVNNLDYYENKWIALVAQYYDNVNNKQS